MIIYTKDQEPISCIKTSAPKFNTKRTWWDSLPTKIGDVAVKFHFTTMSNRSYFYFNYSGMWYKTDMISKSEIDLFHYLENGEIFEAPK